MTVLDLCAGRRTLSAIIGLSLFAPLSPDMYGWGAGYGTMWRYAVVIAACVILVYAFACLMIGRCNIAGLAVAATAFWVTLAMVNLFQAAAGLAILQLVIAALIGFLHVTHDLSGRKLAAAKAAQGRRGRGPAGVVAFDREHH